VARPRSCAASELCAGVRGADEAHTSEQGRTAQACRDVPRLIERCCRPFLASTYQHLGKIDKSMSKLVGIADFSQRHHGIRHCRHCRGRSLLLGVSVEQRAEKLAYRPKHRREMTGWVAVDDGEEAHDRLAVIEQSSGPCSEEPRPADRICAEGLSIYVRGPQDVVLLDGIRGVCTTSSGMHLS